MNPAILTHTFEPTELAFLQRIFDDQCLQRGMTGGSSAAVHLAARIIQLYQQGLRDEKVLQAELDGATQPLN